MQIAAASGSLPYLERDMADFDEIAAAYSDRRRDHSSAISFFIS